MLCDDRAGLKPAPTANGGVGVLIVVRMFLGVKRGIHHREHGEHGEGRGLDRAWRMNSRVRGNDGGCVGMTVRVGVR